MDSHAVYPLPKFVKCQKVFPGIKDLPPHIRTDFRNRFIRVVIRDIFVMDMVIFRTIFFEFLVFVTFTLFTIHFAC